MSRWFGGLFGSDADDLAPEQPSTSSNSSETQDVFAPLPDGGDATPDASASRTSVAGASGAPGRPLRAAGLFSAEPLFRSDDDDGTDTGGNKRRRPLTQRADVAIVDTGTSIETLGDAVDYVTAIMDRQIERGRADGFLLNETITGDTPARNTFYTLLPDREQRSVFMKVAGDMRNWPRLRGLFGAPPYSFLRSEDGSMLRAAGIAAGRSNMAHEDSQSAASYTQFGSGQLVDEQEREYRVTPVESLRLTDPVPWLLQGDGGREITFQVRVKKRDRKRKLEMLKDEAARKTLTFPRPGDRITLSLKPSLQKIQRQSNADIQPVTLLVRRVVPRGESAATAAVVARRV